MRQIWQVQEILLSNLCHLDSGANPLSFTPHTDWRREVLGDSRQQHDAFWYAIGSLLLTRSIPLLRDLVSRNGLKDTGAVTVTCRPDVFLSPPFPTPTLVKLGGHRQPCPPYHCFPSSSCQTLNLSDPLQFTECSILGNNDLWTKAGRKGGVACGAILSY